LIFNPTEFYEELAQKYPEELMLNSSENGIRLYREICEFLDSAQGSLIEFGCGGGRYGVHYKNGPYTGIDIAPTHIKVAKIRCDFEETAFTKEFFILDITDEILRTRPTYDLLLMTEVIEHLPDFGSLFENIRNQTHPNSTILITTPLKNTPNYDPWKTSSILESFGISTTYYHNAFYPIELESILKAEGFEVISSKVSFRHIFIKCKKGVV